MKILNFFVFGKGIRPTKNMGILNFLRGECCLSSPLGDRLDFGVTSSLIVRRGLAGTAFMGPSLNTDQGVQGICESLNFKFKGEIKVKSVQRKPQQSPAFLFIEMSAVKHVS